MIALKLSTWLKTWLGLSVDLRFYILIKYYNDNFLHHHDYFHNHCPEPNWAFPVLLQGVLWHASSSSTASVPPHCYWPVATALVLQYCNAAILQYCAPLWPVPLQLPTEKWTVTVQCIVHTCSASSFCSEIERFINQDWSGHAACGCIFIENLWKTILNRCQLCTTHYKWTQRWS